MLQNNWLRANTNPLVQLKRFLTECEYKPEYDEFPLRPLQKILNGAEAEVNRLQREVNDLKATLKKVQKENTQLKSTDNVQSDGTDEPATEG